MSAKIIEVQKVLIPSQQICGRPGCLVQVPAGVQLPALERVKPNMIYMIWALGLIFSGLHVSILVINLRCYFSQLSLYRFRRRVVCCLKINHCYALAGSSIAPQTKWLFVFTWYSFYWPLFLISATRLCSPFLSNTPVSYFRCTLGKECIFGLFYWRYCQNRRVCWHICYLCSVFLVLSLSLALWAVYSFIFSSVLEDLLLICILLVINSKFKMCFLNSFIEIWLTHN